MVSVAEPELIPMQPTSMSFAAVVVTPGTVAVLAEAPVATVAFPSGPDVPEYRAMPPLLVMLAPKVHR